MDQEFKEIVFVNKSTDGFQFDYVSYEALMQLEPQDHNQFEFHKLSFYALLLITENESKYNLNFKDFAISRGSLFAIRKGNIHKFFKSDVKGHLLVFTENFILNHTNQIESSKTFLLFNEMLSSPKLQLNEEEFDEITMLIALVKKEYFRAKDDYALSIVRSYVQIIISKLFRVKSQKSVVFDRPKYLTIFLQLQSMVEAKCFLHKKVSYYAHQMGVTSKTLNNVTQSVIHKSAKAFINEIVINESKRLIINSSITMTEIAYQMGFEDPTNFFKYFKKYAGITPAQFKTSCK